MPEITKAIPERIFSPFQDTALAALNPIGDYDTTAEFIAENGITPETPVSEIRKIVSEFQKEENAEKEVEAEPEETDGDGNDGNENKKEALEKALETFINAAWDIFGDLNKPKSKRKKTPIKTIEKTCKDISSILDLD